MSLPPSVVIDNGTDSIKSGFAGEEYPCLTFENSIRKINIQSNE